MDTNGLLDQVNESGFPFQIRVREEVKSTWRTHGWEADLEEVLWKHARTGEEGFIDLIFQRHKRTQSPWYVVAECKRVTGGTWVFMIESGKIKSSQTVVLKAIPVENEKSAATLVWSKEQFTPPSFVSSYCRIPQQKNRDVPTMEKDSSKLLNSVESFAREYPHQVRGKGAARFLPMLVTNAQLAVCEMDVSGVDLSKGVLESGAAEFQAVPYVRFQKSFGTMFSSDEPALSTQAAHSQDQRTVLVVQATSLVTLLSNWGRD